MVRERTKGQQLKRKYDDTLSEFERLREARQALELDKDALNYQMKSPTEKK